MQDYQASGGTTRKQGALIPYDPYSQVGRAQQLGREGVIGYGEAAKPGLLREIGTALGGLNAIGSLRSGGANVALGDIATNYSQMIGNYAKQAAGEATGYGLQAEQIRLNREEAKRQRKAGLLKSIGGVLGAGIGFLVGGPPGAAAGAGSGAGGAGASDAAYGGGYG